VPRFLLVSLNIKAILQETTLSRRREKLAIMKDSLSLGDAYDATMGRIKAQGGDRARLGMNALMWISHSERPLSVDEICHALAVETGSTDINPNNVPSIRTVLSCCQGLATVDKGSSTIRMIHFTLKEYLSGHAHLLDRAHSKMAETCLTYLNFQAIKDLSAGPFSDPRSTPFLRYSSLHWGTHIRMELSELSKSLARDLLDQFGNHISAELLWKSAVERHFNSLQPFSALHCISYFGIAGIAIDLIGPRRWDVNQRDSVGLTPLMWAARHGHEETVKLLLQQKHTQPDLPDAEHGRTALSWAAGSGHEGVVRLFLGLSFVNIRRIGRRWGKTQQVMSLLFGRKYVNPDRRGNDGRTPLSWAARNGHDGVVKLLSEREDVNLNWPDNSGRTPLSLASRNGHNGAVKLLLGREDINPDSPDNHGQTPLSLTAKNRYDGITDLLLARGDVSPDRSDNYGRTPLSWVVRNGNDRVVKLLLERDDVSPDRPDNYGRTPLSWAVRNRHDGIAKLLLEREDVSSNTPDNYGQTPLSLAVKNRHDGIMELLLAREGL